MIPKIIHYVWMGGKEIPEQLQGYMASWRQFMPDWDIREWTEASLSQTLFHREDNEMAWLDYMPMYVKQAYEHGKWAFVSDYVRLWALEQFGGVYLDTDVQVLKPFDTLLTDAAFIGMEESLAHLPGTCVMGCEPHCRWVKDMLNIYENIHFVSEDGSLDLTTNVQRMGEQLKQHGFIPCSQEQYIAEYGLRIYTHDYFSPITSTRVMRKTENTYSIHHFAGSWTNNKHNRLRDSWLVRETINALIQIKRKIKGID